MSDTSNICNICGGITRLNYTIIFEECQLRSIEVGPMASTQPKLCPGHGARRSDTEDWEKLSAEQKYDVDLLRKRIGDYLIAQSETFYTKHPELQLSWSMTLDALIRGNHELREP